VRLARSASAALLAWCALATVVLTAAEEAMQADQALMEVHHLCDGVMARETWNQGERIERVDLNAGGKPIRIVEYRDGRRVKRTYRTPDGETASVEKFGADGYNTEYVRYYTDPIRKGREYCHWWFRKAIPIRATRKGGRVIFDHR
jgi:hypothetical protein